MAKGTYIGDYRITVSTIKALLEAEIEVVILSETPKVHKPSLDILLKKYHGLSYRPAGSVRDIDVLIVECGPSSIIFTGKDLPHLVSCNEVISRFEGLVLYFSHDADLGFVFNLESFGPTYFWRGHYQKAPSLSLTHNKTWVVLTDSFDTEEFLNIAPTTRWPYRDLHIPAETVPSSSLYIDQNPLKPKEDPKYDLCYVGNHKSRVVMFNSYYNYKGKVVVYGKWPEKLVERFPYAKFRGPIPQGMATQKLNNAACAVHIGPPSYIKMKHITPRFYEVISAGTILLVDEGFFGYGAVTIPKYVPRIPEVAVVNAKNGHQKIKEVSRLVYRDRKKLWEAEWEGIEHLVNPSLMVDRLIEIIDKYEGVDLHQCRYHQEYLVRYVKGLEESGNQPREKKKFLLRALRGDVPHYYPRVCSKCSHEICASGPASNIRCVKCGGKYPRLERFPR